jgi:hypothetical protein
VLHHTDLEDDDIVFDIQDREVAAIEEAEVFRILLMNMCPEFKYSSAMYSKAVCVISLVNQVVVEKVLFDTGSLTANYVSSAFVEQHGGHLKNFVYQHKSKIVLASKNNIVLATEAITLNLKFTDDDSQVYSIEKEFIILDMEHNDIIIGLPDILNELYPYFLYLVGKARTSTALKEPVITSTCYFIEGEILEPFTSSNVTSAPEEDLTPEPVNFPFALHFLEVTHDVAVEEFHLLIKDRVSEVMQENTAIMQLLRDVGVKVFVPDNWEGIKGIPPLELRWKPDLPERVKPKARPINPKIYETAKTEMERLMGYFYRKSRSPIASPLVFAPKSTKPFIRTCGDYVLVNKYIETGHYYIPNVQHELNKIIAFKIFIDVDMANAFHQILLAQLTSERLSVQTPWGQFEPKFMPEGIGPGSFILQETVREIFGKHDEWMIVIFDNLLILAHSPTDAYEKFHIFLQTCIEHNVILKMSKTLIGYDTVTFFGYKCMHNRYEITDERKLAVLSIPFPEGRNRLTQMRRALGVGVFFKPFIVGYAHIIAPLTEMTKKDFNWDETTWSRDYRKDFENFKLRLQDATAVYFPDYTKDWILRTDASEVGVGAVLLQLIVNKNDNGEDIIEYQPIAFVSHKFSSQATNWTTIEQEAFAIFYAVQKLAYYLVGKEFVLETDHNNLVWMEASVVPKVVRWRIYLQSFHFKIKHIAGSRNLVADWLSRIYEEPLVHNFLDNIFPAENEHHTFSDAEYSDMALMIHQLLLSHSVQAKAIDGEDISTVDEILATLQQETHKVVTTKDAFNEVHNSKLGHCGARLTWHRLNKYFPGHGLSLQNVADLISECPTCLKTRATLEHALKPIIRHLKPPHHRSVLGIDSLEMTPNGKNGETHIIACVNLFTKHIYLYPTNGCTALNLSHAVWHYWSNFGTTDTIISDKGPDLRSELFTILTDWMGIRHIFSITNEHVNGVERVLAEVSRHLRAIVFDSRITDIFDNPTIIPAVQYILNSEKHSETGYTPFELTFGSEALPYYNLMRDVPSDTKSEFLNTLDKNLNALRTISYEYQQKLALQRTSETPPELQNQYQKGDFVLFDQGPKPFPKLHYRYKGPYEVIQQVKNDVTCKHLVMGFIETYNVESLIIFPSTYASAYDAALRDYNQYEIDEIIGHKGNPNRRTTMSFLTKFKDGDVKWLNWSSDLFQSIPYEIYVASIYELHQLKYTDAVANKWKRSFSKTDIDFLTPGSDVFVPLQWLGYEWFTQLNLPDPYPLVYVLHGKCIEWFYKTSKKKITIHFAPYPKDNLYVVDYFNAYSFFRVTSLDSTKHILVDHKFAQQYPQVMR